MGVDRVETSHSGSHRLIIVSFDVLKCHGVDPVGRNDVVWERGTNEGLRIIGINARSQWIIDRLFDQGVRKITSEFLVGRDVIELLLRPAITPAFVTEEEPGFVFAIVEFWDVYGPADSRPEHVLAERRWTLTRGVLERIPSIKHIVSQEFPTGSVQVIAAGFRNDIDHSAQHSAIFRLVVVRLDFEFLNGVDDWQDGIAAAEEKLVHDTI